MNNHLPISKDMKAVMKNHLSEKYSAAETDEHWKKIISQGLYYYKHRKVTL